MESVILELEGRLGCYRVVASESFTIPPRSEVVAYCEMCVQPGNIFSGGGLGIVEPRDHFLDSNKGLVGRTLVQNNSKVPVRFMNLSADANTIHKGTYMLGIWLKHRRYLKRASLHVVNSPGSKSSWI